MQLFQKSLFSLFLFKYVSIPMIILNEHMHLNMIDVYQEKQEWHSGNVPIIRTSFHQKKIPKGNAFLSKFLKKDFLFKRSLIPQQVCSRLLSSEGVIPAPGLGQIVHRRIMHLPHSHLKGDQNFQVPLIPQAVVKDPSTGYPGSQRISPAEGTQTRQKIIKRSQYIHVQMTSGNLFFQLEA